MLRLLIDTSVWLDLAKHRDGQRWIVPLRLLLFQGKMDLLVPSLVIDEFERNRPRAEAAVTANVLERFRLLRRDLHEFGSENRQEWLEEMTHRIPLISAMTLQNFSEISELLRRGRRLEPTEVAGGSGIPTCGCNYRGPSMIIQSNYSALLLCWASEVMWLGDADV
jgi:hypothetical protein